MITEKLLENIKVAVYKPVLDIKVALNSENVTNITV